MAATVYERETCHPETKRTAGAWYNGAKDGTESLLEVTQWALALLTENTETHEAKEESRERPLF